MSASINWRIQREQSEGQEIKVFYDSKYSVQKAKATVQSSNIRIPSICSFTFSTSAWDWINSFLIVHSGPCQKQSHVNDSCSLWIMCHFVSKFIWMYWIWWANNSPSSTVWQVWDFQEEYWNICHPWRAEKEGKLKKAGNYRVCSYEWIKGTVDKENSALSCPIMNFSRYH